MLLLNHFPKTIIKSPTHARLSSFCFYNNRPSSLIHYLSSIIHRPIIYYPLSLIHYPSSIVYCTNLLQPTMLQYSIIRPLVKGWTTPSIRCFAYHHFAPPTFLPSPHIRLSAAKARYSNIQAHRVHKKAGTKDAAKARYPNIQAHGVHKKAGTKDAAKARIRNIHAHGVHRKARSKDAAKARYRNIQAHGVHKKAEFKEAKGKRLSDSSIDDYNIEDDSLKVFFTIFFPVFLFFYFFLFLS
jgi:hypothetical protein